MPKFLLVLVFSLFFFTTVFAQKGGLIYYLKDSGKLVSTKDSADYLRVVLPPDTSVDKSLYIVYEYDKNGKVRLVTNSKTKDMNLLYQGDFIAYYPNGKKSKIGRFEDGNPTGIVTTYYQNGKIYNTKKFIKNKIILDGCRDSTGNVLAENGKGKWIQFNEVFTEVTSEGNIENGIEEGEWHGSLNKNVSFKSLYREGVLVSFDSFDKPNADSVLKKIEVVPEFPGGMDAFTQFLNHTILFPAFALKSGLRGSVTINFVVEVDGSLTNFKFTKARFSNFESEAMRAMLLSPNWKPGMQNKKYVRAAYCITIFFGLTDYDNHGKRKGEISVEDANAFQMGLVKSTSSLETVPEFPGGREAMSGFLKKNIKYPSTAMKYGTQGILVIRFVVEKDGALTDWKIIRGLGDGCDEEASRVMKLMPKWKPGMQDGKPVRVTYSVPISFALSN